MPFGLDVKSLIVGALLVWFVVPWILSMFNRNSKAQPAT